MPVLGLGHTDPATACPECGTPPPADARFCGGCGARLGAPQHRAQAQVLLPRVADDDATARRRRWGGVGALAAVVAAAVAVVVVAGSGGQSLVADEGRTPRGPGASGVTSATSVIPTGVAWRWTGQDQLSESWMFPFPRVNAGVQVGDLLLLDVDGEVRAVDARSGEVQWHTLAWGTDLEVTAGELIVLAGGNLVRLDATTGAIVGRTTVDMFSSAGLQRPLHVEGMAIVSDADGVHGMDSRTGEARWSIENAWIQATVDDAALIVRETVDSATRLLAVDLSTGHELWSEPFDFAWNPAIVEGLVLQVLDRGHLAARDLRTGGVRWSFEGTTLGHDPVPAGSGRIAIWTLADTTTRSARLLVLDLQTGEEVDHIDLPEAGRASVRVTQQGVVARDGVELFLWREGERVWTVQTPLDQDGDEAPVLVVDDLLLHGVEDAIVARELATGQERWRVPISRGLWSTGTLVTAGEDLVVVAPGFTGQATALDRRTGLRLWAERDLQPLAGTADGVVARFETGLRMTGVGGDTRWETRGGSYFFGVAVVDGQLAVSSEVYGDGPRSLSEALEGVRFLSLDDGDETARFDEPGAAVATALGSTIYIRQLERGDLVRVDLGTDGPIERWRRERIVGSDILASEDHVILHEPAGAAILDAPTGRTLRELAYERLISSSPALAGTTLLVATDQRGVEAWNVETGERIWHTDLVAPATRGISVGGEHAFVADDTGHLNTLRISDGTVVGRVDLGGMAAAPPVASDGYVYVVLEDGGVVALR